MCLLFFYMNPNPETNKYKLILVNNRDEFYERPTENAHIWPTQPNIIAGKDVEPGREGGTWLGVSKTGKISCLLNIFHPLNKQNEPRGKICVNFLTNNNVSSEEYIQEIKDSKLTYNPFSLLLFEKKNNIYRSLYYNNSDYELKEMENGVVHGFGNSPYSTPFRKVLAGKEKVSKVILDLGVKEKESELVETLFSTMQCKESFYPDEVLRKHGNGSTEEELKELSSMWISMSNCIYGTRTSTVILVDNDDKISFFERTLQTPVSKDSKFQNTKINFMIVDGSVGSLL